MPPPSNSKKACGEASGGASTEDFFRETNVVAVFDMDGTLTTRDTLLPIAWHYARERRKWAAMAALPAILAGYAARILGAKSAKEKVLKLIFGGDEVDQVRGSIAGFLDRWLPAHLHPLGVERLKRHQAAGHRVILLSASPDLYVPLVAERLEVAESVATRVLVQDARVVGSVIGDNLKGPAKIEAIDRHLAGARSAFQLVAYGDSRSDLPLLNWADRGFLVSSRGICPIPSPR